MWRSLALGLLVAAVVSTAGCGQDGSFRLSWSFQPAGGVAESSSTGCGRYGIDSIGIIGNDATGDSTQIRALCVQGASTGSVPGGTWQFQVEMLDAEGNLTGLSASAGPAPVESGGPQAVFSVTLDPCSGTVVPLNACP